jgi:hypothetical protein
MAATWDVQSGDAPMSDEEFLHQFEDCSLPFENWTHRAHLKVAYLYVCKYPFDEALANMRAGIKALNATHRVPESETRGYNETTTCAMMQLVAATEAAYGATFPTPTADDFCDTHPQLLNKHVLRLFYSPERRMHPDAKSQFIEPDLTQLPRLQPANDRDAPH